MGDAISTHSFTDDAARRPRGAQHDIDDTTLPVTTSTTRNIMNDVASSRRSQNVTRRATASPRMRRSRHRQAADKSKWSFTYRIRMLIRRLRFRAHATTVKSDVTNYQDG